MQAGEKERNPSRLPATADSVALSTHRTPTIAPPAGKTPAKTPSHSIPAQRGRGGRGRPASNQAKLEARASLPLCPNEDLSTRGRTRPETKHCDPPASDENGPWRFRRTHENPLSEDDRYPASFFVTQTVQSPIDRPISCRRVEHKPRSCTRLLCDRSLALVTQHSVRQATLGQRQNVAFPLNLPRMRGKKKGKNRKAIFLFRKASRFVQRETGAHICSRRLLVERRFPRGGRRNRSPPMFPGDLIAVEAGGFRASLWEEKVSGIMYLYTLPSTRATVPRADVC